MSIFIFVYLHVHKFLVIMVVVCILSHSISLPEVAEAIKASIFRRSVLCVSLVHELVDSDSLLYSSL